MSPGCRRGENPWESGCDAMSAYDDPVPPTDENVVLPLPDSEQNIN